MGKNQHASTDDSNEPQARMSFGEHLEELRKRIIRAMLGSAIGIGVCLFIMNDIIQMLVRPYRLALIAHGLPQHFQYARPHEVVVTYLGVAVKAGLVMMSPWIIHQLWAFVAAGLYKRERRIIYRYVGPSALLFLFGVSFFYFFVLPLSLNFFLRFQERTAGPIPQPTFIERFILMRGSDDGAVAPAAPATATATASAPAPLPATDQAVASEPIPLALPLLTADPPAPPPGQAYVWINKLDGQVKARIGDRTATMLSVQQDSLFANLPRLDDYLSFVTFAALVFGLAFETPMVMMILAQIGLVTPQAYRAIRKYAYFGLAVISAITAPGADLVTMFSLMIPLMGLYEVGILVSALVVRRQTDGSGSTPALRGD